jgi:hypothetical protein
MKIKQLPYISLLGVLFIALKLRGVIEWSWVWVTLPIWGGIALAILLLAIYGLIKSVKEEHKPKQPKSKFNELIEQKTKN